MRLQSKRELLPFHQQLYQYDNHNPVEHPYMSLPSVPAFEKEYHSKTIHGKDIPHKLIPIIQAPTTYVLLSQPQ